MIRAEQGWSDSNCSPERNQINIANTQSGEILSLEDSMIGEVHYSTQDAHTWLLDSGATFHVVTLLRACVENEAGPRGPWTEE